MTGKGDVGFIGLGRMGGPMARNLAQAGYSVHVFDVDPAATTRAASQAGIVVQAAACEVAARVPVLFTALPNDAIVRLFERIIDEARRLERLASEREHGMRPGSDGDRNEV